MMLCWTDLLDYHSTAHEETNEDLIQSCSDKSRGLPHSTAHEETNEDLIQSCSDKSRGLPHSTAHEETNEDLIQSCSDQNRGLPQTSHSTEQSVFSSECVRVDTNLNVHEDTQVLFSWQLCNVYIITVLCRFVFRLTISILQLKFVKDIHFGNSLSIL